MVETVQFQTQVVPTYITKGFHSRFIFPIAAEVCKGRGLDVGCGKAEWAFPGSVPIDPVINKEFDAYRLPVRPSLKMDETHWDYIFSSHCLEHLDDYMRALRYWTTCIKTGGTLFLYLPHYDCLYWRPELMPTKKHLHSFDPESMRTLLITLGYKNVFCSGRDLAYSFAVYGEKT